jgi:hypothetical protein
MCGASYLGRERRQLLIYKKIFAFRVSAIARQQIAVSDSAGVAMLAVALALCDQVPKVRHCHVGTMQGEQRFFSVLAFAVATRADHPHH